MSEAALADLLAAGAAGKSSLVVISDSGREQTTWGSLLERAHAGARALKSAGIQAGDTVAVGGPACLATLEVIFATWLSDASVLVLPPPRFSGAWERRLRLRPASLIYRHERYAECQLRSSSVVDYGLASTDFRTRSTRQPALPLGTRIVQFTSGSTGEPTAVLVDDSNLCSNLTAMASRLKLSARDSWVSWLPLYHDMGLIGALLLPAISGADLTLIDTERFRRRPSVWLDELNGCQEAVTLGPHSAYIAAGRMSRRIKNLDLSGVRLALNGSEPIYASGLESFVEAGSAVGLPSSSMTPVYGLAQATLAVTIPDPVDTRYTTYPAPSMQSQSGPVVHAEAADRHVAVGAPLDNVQIKVVRADGGVAPKGAVGELYTAGPSVCRSQINITDGRGRVEATTESEWLATGDLARMHGREVVIVGRLKDVVFAGGRSLSAEEIEACVVLAPGVKYGRVAVFGVPSNGDREDLVIAVEGQENEDRRRDIQMAVWNRLGVRAERVLFVNTGSLPRTTSGKVRRSECRRQYMYAEGSVGSAG